MQQLVAERIRRPGEGPLVVAAWSIVGAAVVGALYIGRDLLIPIALALLLSFVLSPLVSLAKRVRIPRSIAVVALVLMAFGVIVGLGAVLAGQVAQLAGDLPKYQSTMRAKVQSVGEMMGGGATLDRAADLLQDLGEELDRPKSSGQTFPTDGRPGSGKPQDPVPVQVRQPPPTAVENMRAVIEPLIHPLATTGVMIIFVIFILLQREDIRNRFMRLAGSQDIQRTTAALDDAARRLSRLLLTQLALNSAFGLVIGFGLAAIGVPSAALWGIMAAVLRFVPYIGAIIGALLPMALAAAVDPGWSSFLLTAAFFAVTEFTLAHLIEPMAFGRSTGLSPVAVVVSATFWTALWGPIGLVLSTPLTICLVVLGRHVPSLSFLDTLLGDRPALSPPEIFYQRMLARDPIEASEKAREVLQERSLSAYYEEVALPGLLLAQRDAERGALQAERLEALRSSVSELIEDLDSFDDTDPKDGEETLDPEAIDAIEHVETDASAADLTPGPQSAPRPDPAFRVRCVGARTPVEGAAAEIMAQLLNKHGLAPQLEDDDFLLTSGVVEMEAAGPSIVCVAFLDAEEAHVRLVVRRVRRRLPSAYVVAACWTSDERELPADDIRQAARADAVALSLRGVVERCLDEARRRSETRAAATQEERTAVSA
ncbi:AI-2E family transporter [Hansschlegelia beijingensis]|uniref:Putative PurR-regulated permease PerM n=1 Tax=Hansschlegelia beijingensis TaxID=1133344 RepID=A0A7W6D5W7_9HYPH|nr:putative PurR-regulated permease PerM [Hansschlegelia beijingensis]